MNRPLIIAEAGVNHNGDVELAKCLVDVAASVGADIVKFQTSMPSQAVTRNAPKADYQKQQTGSRESQLEMLDNLRLDEEAHRKIFEHCRKSKIEFLSSPFYLGGVDLLVKSLGLKRLKIGSGEIVNGPLLLKAAQSGCAIILSTGMSDLDDIANALAVLAYGYTRQETPKSFDDVLKNYESEDAKASLQGKVTLLHCTTEYPAPFENVNLRAMAVMERAFSLPVGLSDHTEGFSVPVAAVALGAKVIEKHLTLDRDMPGPDHKASLEPSEFKEMVSAIGQVADAMGVGVKEAMQSELDNKKITRKSLVAGASIKKGDLLSEKNVMVKRPGTGMSPIYYWDVLEKPASRSYDEDDILSEMPN